MKYVGTILALALLSACAGDSKESPRAGLSGSKAGGHGSDGSVPVGSEQDADSIDHLVKGGETLEATAGQPFELRILTSPGRPYKWTLVSTQPAGAVEIVSQEYEDIPVGCSRCEGGDALHRFTLKANATGTVAATFESRHVGNDTPEGRKVAITIRVQ